MRSNQKKKFKDCECVLRKEEGTRYGILTMKANTNKEVAEHLFKHHLMWIWSANEYQELRYFITEKNELVAEFIAERQTVITGIDGEDFYKLPVKENGKVYSEAWWKMQQAYERDHDCFDLKLKEEYTMRQRENVTFDLFLNLLLFLVFTTGDYGNTILEINNVEDGLYKIKCRSERHPTT